MFGWGFPYQMNSETNTTNGVNFKTWNLLKQISMVVIL